MKKLIATVSAFALALSMTLIAGQASASQKDDAVAMVKKAAEQVTAAGKEKALATINDPKGPYVKGTLYVFAYTLTGTIIAHPMNSKLVGKDMTEVKDADGKLFTKDFIATANSASGKGWVDYRWTNPESKKIEAKSTYIEKVGDMFLGCGIYK